MSDSCDARVALWRTRQRRLITGSGAGLLFAQLHQTPSELPSELGCLDSHYLSVYVMQNGRVIAMDITITVTRKGQTTLPVAVRRKLGLADSGGVLRAHLNEETGELIITKPPSVNELSERVSRHIKPGTPALLDVDDFYQSERGS